ncbi:hypothetical protein M3P21_08665 [Ruegeria sp. 2012CJ41-6]|uniref:Uncharacterized protein n=1 Tax=Ruegeria spongiae TaxID=2942209 RepID=A0ABT0Q3Z0_9RHOB|nr:hypothetical protein [Ruegeria spongiae]MCL6283609.1 hypothetical protein [Ruegeria spongiae]
MPVFLYGAFTVTSFHGHYYLFPRHRFLAYQFVGQELHSGDVSRLGHKRHCDPLALIEKPARLFKIQFAALQGQLVGLTYCHHGGIAEPTSDRLYVIKDLLTIDHRIDAFCDWNDCEPPELSFDDDGSLILTDNIIDWCREQGASIDWVFCGDPKGMAAAFRKSCEDFRPIKKELKEMNPEQLRTVTVAMKAYIAGIAPLEQTMEASKAALDELKEEVA